MIYLLVFLLAGPITYEQAYDRSQATGSLVVLIESDNCPACVVQERNLKIAEIPYHKTKDSARFVVGLPNVRPITLFYFREGKEWRMCLLKGSIDVERIRDILRNRTLTRPNT